MRLKRFAIFIILIAAVRLVSFAEIPAAYYNSINGKSEAALKSALSTLLYNHRTITSYSDLPRYFKVTDKLPGTNYWWDMYSDIPVNVNTTFGTYMNREHAFPKSWWGGDTSTPAYIDLNHLYPAEAKANQAKSNYPLGEVSTAKFDNGVVKVGYAVTGQGGGSSQVFEPNEEYKGDFARTYFYMVTCYQSLTWDSKYMWMLQQNDYPTLKPWAVDLLLKWHREDPVSQKELDRNEAVYSYQDNRNPFIDYPELAEYIWGNKMGQKFYTGNETPSGDPVLITPTQGSALEFSQVALGKSTSSYLLFKGENMSGSLSIAIAGTDKGMFSIPTKSIQASAVNSDSGFSLKVDYNPTSIGEHQARLIISDGGMEGSLGLALIGECLEPPTLTAPVATAATDIKSDSYTANWLEPDDVVDYYIVTRTVYSSGGASSSEDIMAESNSLLIEGFDESDSESYNVRSCRLGFESPRSNEIFVAHAGITGVEADVPWGWGASPEGVRLLCGSLLPRVTVYDLSGRVVMELDNVEDGTELALAPGLYIIKTTVNSQVLRVIVK